MNCDSHPSVREFGRIPFTSSSDLIKADLSAVICKLDILDLDKAKKLVKFVNLIVRVTVESASFFD